MTENEAIKELKDENEQCYDQCEGCCSEVEENVCTCRDAIILSVLEQYQVIGTVEECREARERQRAKKRILDSYCGFNSYECPVCGAEPVSGGNYCHKCGQRLE